MEIKIQAFIHTIIFLSYVLVLLSYPLTFALCSNCGHDPRVNRLNEIPQQ